MSHGYIYCFSNPSMPGILKIGMTERTPEIRLGEANVSDTWRPPTPYKIEFAKKVSNSSGKEKTLHILLEQYTDRIHPRKEFFRVSPEEIRKFFDLMDGEMWDETNLYKHEYEYEEEDEEEDEEEEEEEEEENIFRDLTRQDKQIKININVKGCRDMTKCFTNGQRIRHTIGINKTWIGIYDSSKNGIIYNGTSLSIYKFASKHYIAERPDRTSEVNGWKECECEVDGKWISTYSLPFLK